MCNVFVRRDAVKGINATESIHRQSANTFVGYKNCILYSILNSGCLLYLLYFYSNVKLNVSHILYCNLHTVKAMHSGSLNVSPIIPTVPTVCIPTLLFSNSWSLLLVKTHF